MKGCWRFQQNLKSGFQFSLPKNCEISSSRRKRQNFKFHQLVLCKRQIPSEQNLGRCFLSWQWRPVQIFSKICRMVCNSAYQNTVKFLRPGEKAKISNFFSWFCLKGKLAEHKIYTGVTCPHSKGLWKVSAKSEPCFPIQPTKILWNFLEQARKPKFQISSFGFV